MSFKLKSQPMFCSPRPSTRFALLSKRKPVNVFVSKPVSFTLRLTLLALLLGTASLLFGQAEQGTTVGVITDISGAVGSGGARFRVLCFPARH